MLEQELINWLDNIVKNNEDLNPFDETTARFSSAVWYNEIQNTNILLAGIGGIGSWTALLISRMKPKNLLIMDSDTVNLVNLAGQFYKLGDVNKAKVTAVTQAIENYCDYHSVMSIKEDFTDESEAYDIMICGFDNMQARKLYFEKWLQLVKNKSKEERYKCLFIDGRLNAEKLQVFTIRGDDYYNMKFYRDNYLFDDSSVVDNSCSYKQTTYCATMIASLVCNSLVNHLSYSISRPLVFFQEYDAELLTLTQRT